MIILPAEITSPEARLVACELPGFTWETQYEPCVQCGEPTTWRDTDFQVRVCPGVCSQKMWDARAWDEALTKFRSPVFQAWIEELKAMKCPNVNCHPPKFCGLCKGTGEI